MSVNLFKRTYMLSLKHLNTYSLVNIKSLRAQFYTNCLFFMTVFVHKKGACLCLSRQQGIFRKPRLLEGGAPLLHCVSLARNANPHPPGIRRLTRLSSWENLKDGDDDLFAWFQVWFSSLFFSRKVACRSYQRHHFPKAFGFLKILAWQMQTLCTYYYFNLRSVI